MPSRRTKKTLTKAYSQKAESLFDGNPYRQIAIKAVVLALSDYQTYLRRSYESALKEDRERFAYEVKRIERFFEGQELEEYAGIMGANEVRRQARIIKEEMQREHGDYHLIHREDR